MDSASLRFPAPEKLVGIYDFTANDPEDLPFNKGDVLTVVKKVRAMIVSFELEE